MKTIQYFSPAYLSECKNARPDDILHFLDDFRALHLTLRHPWYLQAAEKLKSGTVTPSRLETLRERLPAQARPLVIH